MLFPLMQAVHRFVIIIRLHLLWIVLLSTILPLVCCPQSDGKTFKVTRIKTIKEYGKSLDWSHGQNLIASARIGKDGYYDIFVMKPDGSNERSLTHAKSGIPQKHNGNPAWHPSGEYIVFTSEKQNMPAWLGGKILRTNFRRIDIGIACEHIVLEAQELGIGSCILGWFNGRAIKNILDIPAKKDIELVIVLGYPEEKELPERRLKDKSETVSINKY